MPLNFEERRLASLRRGVKWLTEQQSADGAWKSRTYGALRDGAGLTALTLFTLSRLPADDHVASRSKVLAAGWRFLQPGWRKRGTIAAPDGSLDYPTYGLSLLLAALPSLPPEARQRQSELVARLLAAQVADDRQIAASSPDYGGWDALEHDDGQGISTGANVSFTCYALEALAAVKSPAADLSRERARAYLQRAQACTQQGGFAFTADAPSLNNKAEWSDQDHTQPRAYGTATCDGLRGLIATGLTADDAAVQQAVAWLAQLAQLSLVPGFTDVPPERGWAVGLRFYFWQSLARCLAWLSREKANALAEEVVEILIGLQSGEGGWVNESSRMREDDPLIATNFAIQALVDCGPILVRN